eukprot:3651975-Prymnesium_polylepis.2
MDMESSKSQWWQCLHLATNHQCANDNSEQGCLVQDTLNTAPTIGTASFGRGQPMQRANNRAAAHVDSKRLHSDEDAS